MRVWVFGGTAGIGKAVAQIYVARGDDVLCLARRVSDIAGVRSERLDLDQPGSMVGKAVERLLLAEGLDSDDRELRDSVLSGETQISSFRKRWFLSKRGAPDLAVLSSGIGAYIRQDLWRDDWWTDSRGARHAGIDTIFRVNAISRMWAANELIRAMRRKRSGKVVLIGSRCSTRGAHALEVYAASHAALQGYVLSACRHPAKRGVTVGLIEVGWTLTPMTANLAPHVKSAIERELGEMMTAEQAAEQIVSACDRITAGEILKIGK
jgi:NAD(P)-dependent dehydrogenase (short-subunit alcohol dehydrogenase family)